MSRGSIAPLLGPAAVLYLIAAVAAEPVRLDVVAWGTAALALVLSGSLAIAARHQDAFGARRVGWLGLSTSLALVTTMLSALQRPMLVQAVWSLAFGALAFTVVDLALNVPQSGRAPARRTRRWQRGVLSTLAVVAVAGPFVEAASPFRVGGYEVLLPAFWTRSPELAAASSVAVALTIRSVRNRRGASPMARAENAWAQLGLLPATALAVVSLLAAQQQLLDPERPWFRGAVAITAAALVRGHVLLIDPRYRLSVGNAARRWTALTLVLGAVSGAMIALRAYLPTNPLDLALWITVSLLVAVGVYAGLLRVLQRLLAPAGGALLSALQQAADRLRDFGALVDVGAAVLPPLRAACFSPDGQPLLYALDPPHEVSLDAAGQPRLAPAEPPTAILDALRANPHDTLVRRALEDAMVRRGDVRPVVEALQRLDALCAVPLCNQGELEGVLVVPRGVRGDSLSLEELHGLERLANVLGAVLAVMSRDLRATQRVNATLGDRERMQRELDATRDELARLEHDQSVLASGAYWQRNTTPIAYSPKMRALRERLDQLSTSDVPVLLRTPPGADVTPLVQWLHRCSGSADRPLLMVDCGALDPDRQRALLFGSDDTDNPQPGALCIARGGTLVLTDLPALAVECQTDLARTLEQRRFRSEGSEVAQPVNVRVVATARVDIAPLVEAGRFDALLAQQLSPATLIVPRLRERREDLESLTLRALDRAARVLGLPALGIDPAALQALLAHRYTNDESELNGIIERAAARCEGSYVTAAHLKLPKTTDTRGTAAANTVISTAAAASNPLDGTLDAVEKRLLEHAMGQAKGNKSEAARLLGIPRTTLLDKLRRHSLDEAPPARAAS